MTDYRFHLLNVFALDGDPLSGNPLCVFEDARGLDSVRMQALARQFNLSETTFVFPSTHADAHVRIFTPDDEMPFAGHPTLGTAHVVRLRTGAKGPSRDNLTLQMKVGDVAVTAQGDVWTLCAAKAPATRAPQASLAALAQMIGLPESTIAAPPLWVDTGAEQLVIPLSDVAAVRAARPQVDAFARNARPALGGEDMALIWARDQAGDVHARFFFSSLGNLVEDPATGSACANLGGYCLATQQALPIDWTVWQGEAVKRPSRLRLQVTAEQRILVSGLVLLLGGGTLSL